MISIEIASFIATEELVKIIEHLQQNYIQIDFNPELSKKNFYVCCDKKNDKYESDKIIIRFVSDYERTHPKIPTNLKEYYNQGGGEKLAEQLVNYDKSAWKCEIFNPLKNGGKLEYGVSLNEKNFNVEEINKLFEWYLLQH